MSGTPMLHQWFPRRRATLQANPSSLIGGDLGKDTVPSNTYVVLLLEVQYKSYLFTAVHRRATLSSGGVAPVAAVAKYERDVAARCITVAHGSPTYLRNFEDRAFISESIKHATTKIKLTYL